MLTLYDMEHSGLVGLDTITNWLSVGSVCGDILRFVDTRWCALKVVSSMV